MIRKLFFTLGIMLSVVAIVSAQIGDCEAIVTEALGSVEGLCEGLDRNTACYGSSLVDSETLVDPRPETFFAQPGDKESLTNFTAIQPLPLDTETGDFGVSLLNVLADVPNTVPGQAVLLLLVGDAQLTNESGVGDADESAFQSFYFLPGIGRSPCYEADPTLTIQTPGNITTTLYLNGVQTEMSPGTLLTITDSVCTIHRGNIIRRNSEGEIAAVLLANETVDIFIDDEGAINVTNKRGISEREYQRGELIQNALNAVAFENDWQAQFLVPPAEFAEEPATDDAESPSMSSAESGDCDTQHTVSSGETLHMIAQRYDTSVTGIADFNELANARVIYPGQVLCIPNQGSGFEALPAGS
jgi:hypothetical protein